MPLPKPVFLDSAGGRIFCVLVTPDESPGRRTAVLFLPPWAEEMNKSRRMLTLLAHALAASGIAVLLPDLFGTGDSEGDFGDASWPAWRRNVADAAQWLQAQGFDDLVLGGLRTGALLAAEVSSALPMRPSRLLLWQPVVNGSQFLTQFLRLRVAGAMADPERKETTTGLRERLDRGEHVEVAGYSLAPALAGALDALELARLPVPRELPVDWVEVCRGPEPKALPVQQRAVESWQAKGVPVNLHLQVGDAFWGVQELVDVPGLVELSVRLLRDAGVAAAHG